MTSGSACRRYGATANTRPPPSERFRHPRCLKGQPVLPFPARSGPMRARPLAARVEATGKSGAEADMREHDLDGIATLRPAGARIDEREDDHAHAAPALLGGRTDVLGADSIAHLQRT